MTAQGRGYVLLTVGGSGLECAGYNASSEIVNFLVTDADGRTTVHITVEDPSKPSNKYQVCFSFPETGDDQKDELLTFTDRSGGLVKAGDAGLLPRLPGNGGSERRSLCG